MLMTEGPAWLPALSSGERLLWQGQASRQPVVLRMSDMLHLPAGLVTLIIGLNLNSLLGGFGTLGDDPTPRPSMFTLVSVGFIVFGLFELIGRHVINYVRRLRTSYALTTHRAFIHTGVVRSVTRERPLSPTNPPEFKIRGDGSSGTIIFAQPERRRWTGSGRRGRDLVEAVSAGLEGFQFYGVPDADRVRTLLAHD